jgi:integrase
VSVEPGFPQADCPPPFGIDDGKLGCYVEKVDGKSERVRFMPKRAAMMTARAAETMKRPGFHAAGGVAGLYLAITGEGGRSWVFRYSYGGRRRDMGLGPFGVVGLAEARELAMAARRQILAGIDPLEERRGARDKSRLAAARAMTFRQCADAYIAAHEAGWRSTKNLQSWQGSLRDHAYPVIGDLSVAAIDTALVMRVLQPIWATKTETASRVRGRIESVLDWAAVSGYRQGDNPARWKGHLDNLLPARTKVHRVEHHAALPYAEIGGFIVELQQKSSIPARALEFLILTAARSGEVIGARWDEFDLAERVWTIPASRMKAGREHRVPLSDTAMAILFAMLEIRRGDYVFTGAHGGMMGQMALRRVASGRRAGGGDLTAHGFRSSFRDWAAERTAFPGEVAEMALAHAVGDKVEAAYRRGDLFEKRRQLAEAWATFCTMPAITSGEKVVALRR